MSQEYDENESSFDEFCCEQGTEGHCESQFFTVLSANDVLDLMKNKTEQVREVVNLAPANSYLNGDSEAVGDAQLRMLLTKYKWDVVTFLEAFYDDVIEKPQKRPTSSKGSVKRQENKENKGPLLGKRSRPTSSSSEGPISRRTRGGKGNAQKLCDICAGSCDISLIHELSCGHFFCRDCLKQYIEQAVKQGIVVDCIKCPAYACNIPMEDDFVEGLLSKKLKPKYLQLITRGFVANSRLIKWCPSPDCSNAVKVDDLLLPDQPTVKCLNGHEFCFACTEVHDLVPCKLVQEFMKVKAANLNTANWVVRFTKQCPRCNTNIEKNGGCNHITCRQCNHEFCWICINNWRGHGGRHCVAPEALALSNTNLRRLANYDTKLHTMQQSIQLDQAMYKSKFDKQIEDVKGEWFKIDFMLEAVELLLSCRRTLLNSNIFIYFFEISDKFLNQEPRNDPSKVQWLLFARNHAELTEATENLSQKLETIVDPDNFHAMKQEIKDLTTLSKGLHRAVTMQVAEGFDNNIWTKRNDSN